jgi:acetylornithine/succinyldiaminopimelate/putrescine aminotransferase
MSQNVVTMKMMIEQAENDLLHTYNRYQVVLDHGEGVYLYDVEGKKYLDFMSGIGVFALGYSNEYYENALKAQIDKILHTSNYFYNVPAITAAHRIKEVSGMDTTGSVASDVTPSDDDAEGDATEGASSGDADSQNDSSGVDEDA